MNNEEFQKLLMLLELVNGKVDTMHRNLTTLQTSLNTSVYNDNRQHQQIEDIKSSLRIISDEVRSGQVKTISYRIDSLAKTMNSMQQKIAYD